MSYYKEKKTALAEIDSLMAEGKTEEEIIYKISLKYGFGEKLVKDRRKLIDKLRDG